MCLIDHTNNISKVVCVRIHFLVLATKVMSLADWFIFMDKYWINTKITCYPGKSVVPEGWWKPEFSAFKASK